MTARLLIYWISPDGWELTCAPDECDVEIPEGPYHAGDRVDFPEGRKAFVVNRRNGVVTLKERRVHEMMEVGK